MAKERRSNSLPHKKTLRNRYDLITARYRKGWNSKDIIEGREKRKSNATVFYSYNGDYYSLKEWAKIVKGNYKSMHDRKQQGYSTEEIIFGVKNKLTHMKNYLRYKKGEINYG